MVSARLGKQMRSQGFQSFGEYYRHVHGDATGEALIGPDRRADHQSHILPARAAHFDFLARRRPGEFRETIVRRDLVRGLFHGEEPYTIAMTLLDADAG